MLPRRLIRIFGLLMLAAWFAFWLFRGRYAMLDDCFIHLRYADFLLKTHTITYDGIHPSFGTSSPLYVTLLALLRPVFSGPLLPKGLSVCFYLVLVTILLTRCLRPGRSLIARALLAMLTLCLVYPMGIRWLTDGMETPLLLLFAVLLAFLADREMRQPTTSAPRAAGLLLFGFLMTTLRLESSTLLFLVALAIYAGRASDTWQRKRAAALQALPLAIGAVLALLAIRLTLGYFLPDTALAKTGSPSLRPLAESARLLLTSLDLGVGMLLVWLASGVLLLRTVAARRSYPGFAAVLLANAILPVTLALACLRGQFIQGIRYLLWCMVFSTLWNILQIEHLSLTTLARPPRALGRSAIPYPWSVLALVAFVLMALLPIEVHFVLPALKGRGDTFTELRATPLSLLKGDRIMSADVGYLGYFSGAAICDVEGLVDGRAFAAKTKSQRIRACATGSPDVLFLNDFQLAEASAFADLGQWSVCRTYDFAGVSLTDRHYLMVPRGVAASKCPALGGTPIPYRSTAASATAKSIDIAASEEKIY